MIWVVVPAAGSGVRFGDGIPKQYRPLAGEPMIDRTLGRLLGHPQVGGAMVALAAVDPYWKMPASGFGKPVLVCIGAGDRAASVLAALRALPSSVGSDDLVLVHDAARPCVRAADLDRLIAAACLDEHGALLAAPLRDTLKRADGDGRVEATIAREGLWRALTPQAFRRGLLIHALERVAAEGVVVTDEAMAMERLGLRPRLVEGSEDNIKVTVAADLALAECICAAQAAS